MIKSDFNQEWFFYKEGEEKREKINLPHDAMILEERQPDALTGSAGAFFPGGIYHYEKIFIAPLKWQDMHIHIAFEGVYQDAKVLVNGKEIAEHAYGYTPFCVAIHDYLNIGEENIIHIIADNSHHPNSRWYSGSGIYRPVWLYVGNLHHIEYEGVRITTMSTSPARIKVETVHTGGKVEVEILRNEERVAASKGDIAEIEIQNAKLWSDNDPNLYQCHVTLKQDGIISDEVYETFGIRELFWSPKGLFVNGKETLLRGGCVHHDNGILGARCYDESDRRRVKIMKAAGYNALRMAHNPASEAMLKACDEYGMYIMDETWDMWYSKKTKMDYANKFEGHYLDDIKSMVSRDYNHPSVIMYSIGNEVTEPVEEKGQTLIKKMKEQIHRIDKTRAVTCGLNLWLLFKTSKGKGVYKESENSKPGSKADKEMNSTVFNMVASKVGTSINNGAKSDKADAVITPALELLDIGGYNYSSGRYPLEGAAHPDRIIVGSETYPQDIYQNWQMVEKYSYLIGDFVWTSWDYLGEVGLGAWAYSEDGARFNKPYPWLLADTGTIDILGDIGAQAEYAAVVWGIHHHPKLHVRPLNHPGKNPSKMVWRGTNAMPSWSWNGCDGNRTIVEVYTKEDRVALYLNGKLVGKKRVKACKAMFKVKYEPGILSAITYDASNKEVSQSSLHSAKGEHSIRILPEKSVLHPNELVYINIDIVGENGVVEANHDIMLEVRVTGGELLAFGSANPRTKENYNSGCFTTYYGKSLAVVKAEKDGQVIICVTGQGVKEKRVRIPIT